MLIVAIFSFESGERLELNSERLYRSLEKEEESRCLVFTSSNLVPRSHSVLPWEIWVRDARPPQNVKLGLSRRGRAVTAKKCTKKRDARAKLLFCRSKPIAFLLFSLTSPLSLSSLSTRTAKKNNRFRSAKQKLCTYFTVFCTLLCRHCPTAT